MRRHVTEDFLETYQRGLNQYLEGRWTEAFQCFEKADDIMIRTVLEEGYIEITDDELLDALVDRIAQLLRRLPRVVRRERPLHQPPQ